MKFYKTLTPYQKGVVWFGIALFIGQIAFSIWLFTV